MAFQCLRSLLGSRHGVVSWAVRDDEELFMGFSCQLHFGDKTRKMETRGGSLPNIISRKKARKQGKVMKKTKRLLHDRDVIVVIV